MYRLANHEAAVQNKHQSDRVEFEDSALSDETERNVVMSPALGYPVGHETGNAQSGRDRCALKVLRLAALILRENSNCDVEASQAGQTAENEESQENMVERGANTERKGSGSGGEAERNLPE